MPINWAEQADRTAREDIVLFINACLSCTGQREFYEDGHGQRVSIDFLHEYILVNYRLLYARTLAAGINHFNQAQIILKLLASGQNTASQHRKEESALINAALRSLPSQRAWDLLQQLARRGINNRRSRAIARDFMRGRRDLSFDCVKYRSKVRVIASHSHLKLEGELGPFLFREWTKRSYNTQLLENFRQAHFSAEAVYTLPFTVAEGLARKHKIDQVVFLSKIQEKMTMAEKLRFQSAAERAEVRVDLDLGRMPLTKLALYILSLSSEQKNEKRTQLETALKKSAAATLRKSPMQLGRVAAILDCSYSSSGSTEKRRRPLGIALAVHYLLQAAAKEYKAFWTTANHDALLVQARGQTNIAEPLLQALEWKPETVILLTDGWENDPPGVASELIRVFKQKFDPSGKVSLIHCNPVFAANNYSLHPISSLIPTVGLRDAEDLPTALGFARFADGSSALAELESYLAERVRSFLKEAVEPGQEPTEQDFAASTSIIAEHQ